MTSLIDRWPRIGLSASTFALTAMLLLVTLFGGAGSSAAPTQQTPPPSITPAAQPAQTIRLTDPVPDPKQAGVVWFAPTGHTLRGAFLDYWNRYGGLAQFGYPLTEEFYEEISSDNKLHLVQYFERNRFEYHPENKGTQYEVLLGVLGLDFRKADPPVVPVPNARFFSETGHNLSGLFKAYWDAHGGLFVHGYPVTEAVQERSPTDGKIYTVQYFQRSRFELHPENAGSPNEVLLGLLGRQLSEKKGYPYGSYPQFGYSADYSWFAGYYRQDPRRCAWCGCKTVNFVRPKITYYEDTPAVLPYGPDWPDMLNETGLNPTTSVPQRFIVVFGQLDDPESVVLISDKIWSCLAPKFKVSGLQFNSVR